jgi:hypothetical protein
LREHTMVVEPLDADDREADDEDEIAGKLFV